MTEIEKLEVAKDVAMAELGLIEELRSIVAVLGVIVVNDHLVHSWPIAIALGAAAYMAIPYWHGKKFDAASDAVEKATGTGKYYQQKTE